MPQGPERVIAYIDGFNLYHGLRDAGFRRYYWLDATALAGNLLKPRQADSPAKAQRLTEKRRRQSAYLDALGTLRAFRMFEGHYLAKDAHCRQCGAAWTIHEEKMTDVNIATELLVDAFQDAFDTALLVSADSDLVAPVRAVCAQFPAKRIVIAFPPRRQSVQLKQAASACFTIGRAKLAASQLPDRVTVSGGFEIRRPDHWRR